RYRSVSCTVREPLTGGASTPLPGAPGAGAPSPPSTWPPGPLAPGGADSNWVWPGARSRFEPLQPASSAASTDSEVEWRMRTAPGKWGAMATSGVCSAPSVPDLVAPRNHDSPIIVLARHACRGQAAGSVRPAGDVEDRTPATARRARPAD